MFEGRFRLQFQAHSLANRLPGEERQTVRLCSRRAGLVNPVQNKAQHRGLFPVGAAGQEAASQHPEQLFSEAQTRDAAVGAEQGIEPLDPLRRQVGVKLPAQGIRQARRARSPQQAAIT